MKENNLPELPSPAGTMEINWGTQNARHVDAFTADQMREYALSAITAAEANRAKREGMSLTADRIIFDALRRYKLSHAVDEFGGNYPLVDLLTPDGRSISEGEAEMELIADAIACALSDRALLADASLHIANAPQVPEALPITEYTTATPLETQMAERQYAHGWNACREAMLSAAPQPEQKG